MKYRNKRTGDYGELVTIDGVVLVKRVGVVEQPRRYIAEEWVAEDERRSFTPMQIASVAFAADRALCALTGKHTLAREKWAELQDRDRRLFLAEGPPKVDTLRREVFEAIVEKLVDGSDARQG